MRLRSAPHWASLLVNLSTLLWASNIVLGRMLRGQIGPATLAAARFSVAALLFIPLLRRFDGDQVKPAKRKRDWLLLLGMGLSGVFAFPTLMYLALNYTTVTNAVLINGTSPLVTVFLAGLLLRERITLNLILGTVISLVGVAFVISNGSLEQIGSLKFNLGDLIVLLIVGLWGIYSILGRLATRRQSSLSATAYSTWLALPLLVLAAGFEWRASPPLWTPQAIVAAIYIGIFPSVIAFLAWNEGVRRAGPNQAMAFYNMLPVYGVLLGVLFLGETLTWHHLLGGALVVGGGLIVALSNSLANRNKKRKRIELQREIEPKD